MANRETSSKSLCCFSLNWCPRSRPVCPPSPPPQKKRVSGSASVIYPLSPCCKQALSYLMASTYLPLHLVFFLGGGSIPSGNTGAEPPFWCQLIRSGGRCDRSGALTNLVVHALNLVLVSSILVVPIILSHFVRVDESTPWTTVAQIRIPHL